MLWFTIAGHEIGDEVVLPVGGGKLTAHVTLRSNVPVDHLQIVGAGGSIVEIPLRGARMQADTTIALPGTGSGWFVLRAWSERAELPVLDLYPFASTSPIYVSVGGMPVRSPVDATFFVRWIDRLLQAAAQHPDWRSEAERISVLAELQRARAVFVSRGGR